MVKKKSGKKTKRTTRKLVVRDFVKNPVPPIPPTVRMAAESLEAFLSYFPTFELLTADEEVWLSKEIHKGKRSRYPHVRDRLIVHNIRLVVHQALRYARQRRCTDPSYIISLISDGMLGLLVTSGRYRWQTGNRFSTYATHWIRRFIHRGSNELRFIRLPHYIHGILAKTPSTIERMRAEGNECPTAEQIAEEMNERVGSFELAVEAGRSTNIVKPVSYYDDEDWTEYLEGETEEEVDPLFTTLGKENTALLWKALDALKTREAMIVMMRHGIECEPMTLAEIGAVYRLSRERIRQIEREALTRMQRFLEKIYAVEGSC